MDCRNKESHFIFLNRVFALGIFLLSLTLYCLTAQPSVAYWDCAEYAATSPRLEVPHPPGAPLFTLMTRLASMVPDAKDKAMRMNLFSALTSALAVMLLYLIAVRAISRWRDVRRNTLAAILAPAGVGALTLVVSDTFWFNAVESGLFATSIFFISLIIWLGVVWFEKSGKSASDRVLLLAAYILGLSSGVHQLCLLSFFPVALLVYFKNNEFQFKSFLKFSLLAILGFFVIYPGIVKWMVAMMSGDWNFGPFRFTGSLAIKLVPAVALAASLYGIISAVARKRARTATILTGFLLVLLGYSTYSLIYLRANSNPAINEGDPATMKNLESYLDRAQYGEQPLFWPRRWNPDPKYLQNYARYSSDLDYFLSYQVDHMYLRYLGFNFIGRSGDVQDAPVAFISAPGNQHDAEQGYPARYFAIPFILGLIGIWYHYKKDWKLALVFTTMFVAMGFALTVYFNMADPQPRERDYFFVGSFFVFALWIAIGASGIMELVSQNVKRRPWKSVLTGITVGSLFLACPVNMFRENLFSHDRHDNYAPLDVSYDILQSCPRNAILFTGGDNDTFPLWYLQETCGVRTDVRIICLSLANTSWYLLQLKNNSPHGSERVPFTYSNQQIKEISDAGGVQWHARTFRLPVSPGVYKEFRLRDTSKGGTGYIEYTMNPTIGGGAVRGVRPQDLMVNNIVMANDWHRPICFAIGVPPHDLIGLQKYFMRQGLVNLLTPGANISPYYEQLNEPVMHECLFHGVKRPRAEQKYGFMFKGLDKRGVYYDSNTRNMMYALRDSFIRLAAYYQSQRENVRCVATLDTMEARIPVEAAPLDYATLGSIAQLYYLSGDEKQFRKFSSIAESGALAAIQENPDDLSGSYNPYSVLLGLYNMEHDYRKERALLERLHSLVPNDSGIDKAIATIKAYIKSSDRITLRDSVTDCSKEK